MKPATAVVCSSAAVTATSVLTLPYLCFGDRARFSLWEVRELVASAGLVHPYVILVAMIAPASCVVLAPRDGLPRWQALVCALCFAVALVLALAVFVQTRTRWSEHAGPGAKVVVGALSIGLVASVREATRRRR